MREHIKQFLQTHKVTDFSKNFQRYHYMNIIIFTNISQKYPKNKYSKIHSPHCDGSYSVLIWLVVSI